jgi:hypothetical protein
MLNADIGVGCGSGSAGCGGAGSCPSTPDFCIKRHDTRPAFRISMSDCDGPVDLTEDGIVLEASMWFDAKLRAALEPSDTELRFADDIGFDSVSVGDVIVTARARSPEKMLVTEIDESTHAIEVERGYGSTVAGEWDKGVGLRVFRFSDEPAVVESVLEDVESVDGSTAEELTDTLLVFNWTSQQTAMPGCYWFEFKIMKVAEQTQEVEWVKRVPLSSEGFVVNIVDSPTSPT